MANMVCSKCNVGWEILEYDRFCGYCGCEVFGFSVKWKGDPQFYIGDGTDIRELAILVENTGASPIIFQSVQFQPGNALEPPPSNEPFEVKPGRFHTIEVRIDPKKLTTIQPERVTVRIQDALSNLETEKSLTLQALPRPDFKLTPRRAVLRYPKSKKTETVKFNVEFQQNQFSIEDIKSSKKWIKNIDLSEEANRFRLEVDCNKLKEGFNSETLRFKLDGPSQLIEQQIQIQAEVLPEPAKLFVPEENLEIIQDREKNYTLKLENKGEDLLTIKNIALGDSIGLVQLPDIEFPITLKGGGHRNIDLSVSAVDIEPAIYPIDFTIRSNCDTAPAYQHTLNVTINPREEYPHYLAIDFGTTNSCCAYIDRNYDLKLVPLDSEADPPDIMPSSIIYRSQPKNQKSYDVGYDAETYRTSREDGPYYISSVKRWLGYRWHRQFPNNQELQPCDVVSHILRHIVTKAEDHLEQHGIPSKITRCMITHPTMFTPKQQDDLKQAFGKIDITDLILIDEASAASMGTVFEEERYETQQEDYRLLVYDFGGGTIDIVLSQVAKHGNDMTIEPIARGGNPRYGGDDVTQAIVDFVLREYGHRIQQAHPGINFYIPYFEPRRVLKSTEDPKIDEATRRNAATLYRRAEEMKKELNTQQETEFFASLEVVVGNDINTLGELTQDVSSVKLSNQQLQHFIEPALNDTFADIDKMIADNGGHLPNTVILAGQSSKMRIVKDLMSTHFEKKYETDIKIHLGENPKTCVVMGAVQYSLARSLSDEKSSGIQIVNLSNRTLSRLGIARRVGIKPVFGEIIPKGKLIPDESVRTIEFRLDSRTPYVDVLEHFGLDNDLKNASRIASYTLNLPKGVSRQALKEARLKMAVKANGEIELTAIVDGEAHKSTVEKREPEFVDEIHGTESAVETGSGQAVNVYQQKAEEVIRETQEQVAELARTYRDGDPINIDDV